MRKKILWITQTGMMLALLVAVQWITASLGQMVTGSCVNAVLSVAALLGGLWCGLTVALISPFLAFAFGIGPQLVEIVPAIAVGNAALVALLCAIHSRKPGWLGRLLAWLGASVGKFAALYLLVVQLLCRVLPLKPPQIANLTAMFSIPQLLTALIGSGLAILLVPVLKKALKKT